MNRKLKNFECCQCEGIEFPDYKQFIEHISRIIEYVYKNGKDGNYTFKIDYTKLDDNSLNDLINEDDFVNTAACLIRDVSPVLIQEKKGEKIRIEVIKEVIQSEECFIIKFNDKLFENIAD